jgi:hypothetical protein
MSAIIPNPNVQNAKRRGGIRPKSVNTPRDSKSSSIKWIEPLPQPVSVDTDFAPFHEMEYSGLFELKPDFPSTVAEPFNAALDGLVYRTTGDTTLATAIKPELEAMTYIKTAQKMYGTMTQDVVSRVQPLKAVHYDDHEFIDGALKLIDMVGNFESRLGKFRLKYQEIAFRRLIVCGLNKSLVAAPALALPAGLDPEKLIWPGEESIQLIHELANEQMALLRKRDYRIRINMDTLTPTSSGSGEPSSVTTTTAVSPKQPDTVSVTSDDSTDSDFDPIQGPVGKKDIVIHCSFPSYSLLNRQHVGRFPPADVLRWMRLGILLQVQSSHLATDTTPPNTPANVDLGTLLGTIGLSWWNVAAQDTVVRNALVDFQVNYTNKVQPHMRAYFKLSTAVKGETGYAAQLVETKPTKVSAPFELSDADMAAGFLTNPNLSCTFTPVISAYSKVNYRAARAKHAADGLQSIAH